MFKKGAMWYNKSIEMNAAEGYWNTPRRLAKPWVSRVARASMIAHSGDPSKVAVSAFWRPL